MIAFILYKLFQLYVVKNTEITPWILLTAVEKKNNRNNARAGTRSRNPVKTR